MSARTDIPDEAERRRALDPAESFIVQAPAGSGKTELLIQRFLKLLATVDQPEEVLAVTFTRKAAGEMRSRVIAALLQAESGVPPEPPHLKLSYELAGGIVRHEVRRNWQLHRHPARLRIGTIDGVNAWLAGCAPLTSGGSGLRRVTETPDLLYREAARATLATLGDDDAAAEAVAALLRHLDNDATRFERLLVAMLPRREQWLRHVVRTGADRTTMEAPLRHLAGALLRRAADCIDAGLAAELTELLSYASIQLGHSGRVNAVAGWAGRSTFPAADPEFLPLWQGLAAALLTAGKGAWRKAINITNGFPAGTAEKTRMESLLQACGQRDELREALLDLQLLPGIGYSDEQWGILRSLLDVLQLAAAQLQVTFSERGESDFSEVAANALRALGSSDDPSELGLALDYRIRHILVDEFQDTSWSQFELLAQLTAGWERGDGRTLFLVGDPMQSIYRFREADVGVFMRVRDEGIGQIRPAFLQLVANFRSTSAIVRWTNEVFSETFPARDEPLRGAVQFARSIPVQRDADAGGVTWHWLPAGDDHAEDQAVLAIVRGARDCAPGNSVCILVRSRSHASRVLGALRTAGIRFVAPDLENMERASVAQDLLALARALINPDDRLAWIGVLRAPWCGLSLADLHALLGDDFDEATPTLLADPDRCRRLSPEGARAVSRLLPVVERAALARGRRSLRDLVEGAWLELGGPATVREQGELETAEAFLDLLESHDHGGDCPDVVQLGEAMRRRKGSLGSGDPGVQVMTMHKAKGLEFDTVILPGLGKTPRGDEPALLAWQDIPVGEGQTTPVLAPMAATGSDGDPLYQYLMRIERARRDAEAIRLLYVACTRARTHLHLCAQLQVHHDTESGEISVRVPRSGSLLQRLWPAVDEEASRQAAVLPVGDHGSPDYPVWVQPLIRHFRPGLEIPTAPPALRIASVGSVDTEAFAPEYDWAGDWTRHVGTVVHRWMQLIAEQGLGGIDEPRLRSLRPRFRRQLEQRGTLPADIDKAVDRVVAALSRVISDERGRWILSDQHAGAECELPLVAWDGRQFRQVVVDRTFVTTEGCRWIIDYKTSAHEGGDLAEFLDSEARRYEPQLRRYRDALAAYRPGPIRSALYYPLLGEFREVSL